MMLNILTQILKTNIEKTSDITKVSKEDGIWTGSKDNTIFKILDEDIFKPCDGDLGKEPDFLRGYEKIVDIQYVEIAKLDESIVLNDAELLTDLSDETKIVLQEQGYSDDVIENIGSEEEAEIYQNADLEGKSINGKDALIRQDINLDQKDAFGDTNLERMEKGKAPLDAEGKPYELHHIGQKADSPLAELTRSEHMGGGNNKILHDVKKESEINRTDFNKERSEHWKARAEDIKNQEINEK